MECASATLETGDYSIIGLEHLVTVERKELGDYWTCMGKRRFRDCLVRLAAIPHSCVVVEADHNKVLADEYIHWIPQRNGRVKPSRITGPIAASITRWNMARYGVPIWFAGDRERGQVFTLKFLETSWQLVGSAERKRAIEQSKGGTQNARVVPKESR